MEMARHSDVVLVIDEGHTNVKSIESELKNHAPSDDEVPRNITKTNKNLRRLSFSKPKARLHEYNYPNVQKTTVEYDENDPLNEQDELTDDSEEEDDYEGSSDDNFDEDDAKTRRQKRRYIKKKKFQWRLFVEWVMFIAIMTCLVCSLTIKSLKSKHTWGLEIWKWCLVVLVTFCGRLVSGWMIGFAVFVIERNFMLREKVLYFVYGLRKSIQNCVWIGLILLAWTIMFSEELHKRHKFLKKARLALIAGLVDATIWLIKIVLVKMLASSFHVATYFDRMKESVFHHYILDALSGPPLDETMPSTEKQNHNAHITESKTLPSSWKRGKWKESRNAFKSKKYGSRRIDIEKLRKLGMQTSRRSAWSVKRLVSYIMSSGLSTISKTVDDFGKAESEITSEWEARNAARRIFKNVAKPGAQYIEEEDLMRFLKRVEVHTIFPLFEGALETGKISKSAFRNWVVRAYLERKSLAHSLNDTKTAVQQLHKLASGIIIVIIVVVTLMLMGLATPKMILVVMTQLVIIGVIFQNMCKTVFESIIFVFIMHPFDIGDRCVIDGVQMIVEEMNILTTVFLRYDMEKIYYPNAVLLTKPISNFYRSPEMGDAIDFTIDMSTSMETIVSLKKAIQVYIESKPNFWNPKHTVIVKQIDCLSSLKMCLCVQHTINHQNYGERNARITELILELKKIFESLGITYHLLPQEIHLTKVHMDDWRIPMQS